VRHPFAAAADVVDPFDVIMRGLSKTQRAHIRSANSNLNIHECSPDEFVKFYGDNLQCRGVGKSRYSLDVATALLEESIGRGQGEVFVASHSGEPLAKVWDAAIACVWDDSRYYLWMATRRASEGGSGPKSHPDAIRLLIVNAMVRAQSLNLVFDADSPGTPGAQQLYGQLLRLNNSTEARHVFIRETAISMWGTRIMRGRI
jgi:hypothetical protein